MVTVRPPCIAGVIGLGLVLIVASFNGGRVVERRAQQQSNVPSKESATITSAGKSNRLLPDDVNQSDHILLANVATVSFSELWDVMRAAAPEKRSAWARELERMPPGTRRNAAIKSFYKIWSELDPTEAIKSVEKITDKRMQSMAFYAAADAAAESALQAFAELENHLGYRVNSFSSTSILARWAAADPPAVARFLEEHPQTVDGIFMGVMYCWANSEPEKAADWFTNLKLPALNDPKYPRAEDRRRLEAARGLLLSWLEKDSRGAAAFVATHADEPEIKQTLAEFGLALCTKSRDEATAFILSLPTEEAQRAALGELLTRVGRDRAITIREGGDEEEPEEPEIGSEQIRPWLIHLPSNLWIDQVGEIFQSWDETDSASAEAWLRTLSANAKSKAILYFCNAASVQQAPRVFEIATLIDNPTARSDALQKFVANLSDDPTEARAKIVGLQLTTQQKQMLLRFVSQSQ